MPPLPACSPSSRGCPRVSPARPRTVSLASLVLLAATAGLPAAPYLEASFDPLRVEGLLVLREAGVPDQVLHRVSGRHVDGYQLGSFEGRPAVRLAWASHPRGDEAIEELWVRARPDELVRVEPGAGAGEAPRIPIPEATSLRLPPDLATPPLPRLFGGLFGGAHPGEDLTPEAAHQLLDQLGFYRPIVMVSLKRRYQAYVRPQPRPPAIPEDEFPRYQMALLALAQGAGGPNQATHRINRARYFDKGRAFDLEARVIDWYSHTGPALREVLADEGRRLDEARARYPDLPEIGRLATPDLFGELARGGAEALEPERVGLTWGLAQKAILIDSLMQQESSRVQWKFQQRPTTSAAGAIGLGQLMPFNREYHPEANEYDPRDNAVELARDLNRWLREARHPSTAASRRASRYFSTSPEGRLRFALAMYNGGYATTRFAREVYSPSIMRMVKAGGPQPPVELPPGGSRRPRPAGPPAAGSSSRRSAGRWP